MGSILNTWVINLMVNAESKSQQQLSTACLKSPGVLVSNANKILISNCVETKKYPGNGVVPPKNPLKYIIWSLFGNEEDGPIGDSGWNPTREDNWLIRLKWWIRNPLHNFAFYTLGNMHKDVTVYGWPSVNVFDESGGWLFTLAKTDRMWYPFVSYYGPIKFYIGWRLGNSFGIKLTHNKDWKK